LCARVGNLPEGEFPCVIDRDLWQIMPVRAGLRPQIVLLLALVLAVSFVPLYFAVATYTTTAQAVVRRQQAVELAHSVVAAFNHLEPRTQNELSHLLTGRVIALRRVTPSERVAVSSVHLPSLARLDPVTPEAAPAFVSTDHGTWVGLSLAPA
jgi:hypothetical protein